MVGGLQRKKRHLLYDFSLLAPGDFAMVRVSRTCTWYSSTRTLYVHTQTRFPFASRRRPQIFLIQPPATTTADSPKYCFLRASSRHGPQDASMLTSAFGCSPTSHRPPPIFLERSMEGSLISLTAHRRSSQSKLERYNGASTESPSWTTRTQGFERIRWIFVP